MRKGFRSFIVFLVVSALGVGGALFAIREAEQTIRGQQKPVTLEQGVPHVATNMRADFYESLFVERTPVVDAKPAVGMIVSHHLFMEAEIGKLFANSRGQKPSVVVVLGPNHFNVGGPSVQTSANGYRTPFGLLAPSTPHIQKLLDTGLVIREERPFENEHAVGAVVPYIKHTWPEAKLVPIILKRSVSVSQVEKLAEALQEILPEDALVIASVDFSHHLDRFSAAFHDAQSISALLGGDTNRIVRAEVDSPQSLSVLLRFLQGRGALHMDGYNTNQALYTPNLLSDDVTSYVFARFTQGAPKDDMVRTFMHYGLFGEVAAEQRQYLQNIADTEGNYFRGVDLKVIGIESVAECPPDTELFLKSYNMATVGVTGCATTKSGQDISFVSVFNENDVRSVARAREAYKYVVVQAATSELARAGIDAGARAAFYADATAKATLYNGFPLFGLARPGHAGTGVGITFSAQSITAYFFPYEVGDGLPVRPTLEKRLRVCKQLLAGLTGVDGCSWEIKNSP